VSYRVFRGVYGLCAVLFVILYCDICVEFIQLLYDVFSGMKLVLNVCYIM